MKPGTPCIIEPSARATPEEREQLGGLIVAASHEAHPGFWRVLPVPVIVFSTAVRDVFGVISRAGRCRVLSIPVDWLRPLRGDPAPTESEPAAERVLEGVPLQ